MKLSQRTKYALRALQRLGRSPDRKPMLISELAEKEMIPRKFLEAILLALKNEGILQSKKGKGGGYFLREDPEKITVGRVVRIFDGMLAPLPCVSEKAYLKCDECVDEKLCATRQVMKDVRDAIAQVVDRVSLADLIRRADELLRENKVGITYQI